MMKCSNLTLQSLFVCNYRFSRLLEKPRRRAIFAAKIPKACISTFSTCIFIQQDVLVSGWGKGCISHLKNNHLQAGNEVKTSKLRKVSSVINQSEITVLLRDLRERILEGFSKKLDFRETLNNLIGLSYDQFEDSVNRYILNRMRCKKNKYSILTSL